MLSARSDVALLVSSKAPRPLTGWHLDHNFFTRPAPVKAGQPVSCNAEYQCLPSELRKLQLCVILCLTTHRHSKVK